MSKTITIEVPNGHEIESFDKGTGVIRFKEIPKTVFERIKTIKDVYRDNEQFIMDEYNLNIDQFIDSFKYLTKDEIAYRKMKLICRTFNEGWQPDWKDSSQRKYFQWFYMGEDKGSSGFRYDGYDYWDSGSSVGSRLCFKSSKIAKHTAELFLEIYKNYHY